MPVDIDIDHVARLARIALTDEEKTSLRRQLGVIPRANVLREDVPEPCLPVEEALRNVPDREGDKVRVPRITEIGS